MIEVMEVIEVRVDIVDRGNGGDRGEGCYR